MKQTEFKPLELPIQFIPVETAAAMIGVKKPWILKRLKTAPKTHLLQRGKTRYILSTLVETWWEEYLRSEALRISKLSKDKALLPSLLRLLPPRPNTPSASMPPPASTSSTPPSTG